MAVSVETSKGGWCGSLCDDYDSLREGPSSLEFVIFPAAGEKYHTQTCHHVLARANSVTVSPGTVRHRGMRLIRPCEDCQPLR